MRQIIVISMMFALNLGCKSTTLEQVSSDKQEATKTTDVVDQSQNQSLEAKEVQNQQVMTDSYQKDGFRQFDSMPLKNISPELANDYAEVLNEPSDTLMLVLYKKDRGETLSLSESDSLQRKSLRRQSPTYVNDADYDSSPLESQTTAPSMRQKFTQASVDVLAQTLQSSLEGAMVGGRMTASPYANYVKRTGRETTYTDAAIAIATAAPGALAGSVVGAVCGAAKACYTLFRGN